MADGDLLLSALAAGLLKSQSTQTQTGTPPPSGGGVSVAQFSPEQIAQLANAISQIQIPAPQVSVPAPVVNVPPAQATISDEQISRIISASRQDAPISRKVENRFLQISNITGTTINTLAGGAPNGSYPNIVIIDKIQFVENVDIIAVVLSVSMLNTGTEPMGVYAAKVQQDFLNLVPSSDPTQRSTDIYLSLLTHNNSTGVTNAPASRTSSIAFSPSTAPVKFKSGQSIGIYACSQNIATALVAADLSVYYIPEDTTANNAV